MLLGQWSIVSLLAYSPEIGEFDQHHIDHRLPIHMIHNRSDHNSTIHLASNIGCSGHNTIIVHLADSIATGCSSFGCIAVGYNSKITVDLRHHHHLNCQRSHQPYLLQPSF